MANPKQANDQSNSQAITSDAKGEKKAQEKAHIQYVPVLLTNQPKQRIEQRCKPRKIGAVLFSYWLILDTS